MLVLSRTIRTNVSYRRICDLCLRRHVSLSAQTVFSGTASQKLPAGPARTRFAPSPTGYPHLGSLRTALFNYLLAKATGGQFILRIEDTDQARTVADAEDRLHQDLEWAGLQCDEGPRIGGPFGPYRQSQRTALYREHAEILLHTGRAYRCFCSPERLHAAAKQRNELGLPMEYDRTCARVTREESDDRAAAGEAHVIRFMVPPVYPRFTDLVYGKVRSRQDQVGKAKIHTAFEDPVLIKSDGFPTYHLANVVDDHHMGITHVVRGAEWLSSTPTHLAIYEAFEWAPPAFAHVGLLVDQNKQKLSKRNMDIDISLFRDKMGIFPETLTNFIALLGWSHRKRSDVMDLQDLMKNFTMKFTTGDAMVTLGKLWYLQRSHAERYAQSDKIVLMTKPILEVLKEQKRLSGANHVLGRHDAESFVIKLVQLDARNYTDAAAFVARNKYFFETPDEQTLRSSRPSGHLHHVSKDMPSTVHGEETLQQVLSSLELIPPEGWMVPQLRDNINTMIKAKVEESLRTIEGDHSLDLEERRSLALRSWAKLIYGQIRWAITAGLPGPEGAASMQLLGREETLDRLTRAAKIFQPERDNGSSRLGY